MKKFNYKKWLTKNKYGKANPNYTPLNEQLDHVDTNIWYGCSVCGPDSPIAGETACQPLIPFQLDIPYDSPANNQEAPPGSSNFDWGILGNGEGTLADGTDVDFDELLVGSDGEPYDYASWVNTVAAPDGVTFGSGGVLFNGWALGDETNDVNFGGGMYGFTPESYCPGEATNP